MNNRTESIWHDSRTDTMSFTDPGHGQGPYKVDTAQGAADFWNAYKDARGSMLRDRYNGHYWGTAEARAEFAKHAAAPVAKTKTAPVVVPVQPKCRYTQLWEPCDKCGAEPSYQTAAGHLCASCGGDWVINK